MHFELSLNTLFACLIWVSLAYLFYRTAIGTRRSIQNIQRHHAIPCTRCRYFTGEMVLKCPVNPKAALTDQAVDCLDFVGEVH